MVDPALGPYKRGYNDARFGSTRPPDAYLPDGFEPNLEHDEYMQGQTAQQRQERGLPPKQPGPAHRPKPERLGRALAIKDRPAGKRYLRGRAD